jgi:nucleotide-binding universal stress UspA family protein
MARLTAAGLPFRPIVEVGAPAEVIAQSARELGATRIVMGTRGAGAMSQLLFGSTAKGVLHLCEVPVTLVK